MHLVVIGAGALGTLFGVKAAQGGAKVTLVGREAHMNAVNDKGVCLTGDIGKDEVIKSSNITGVTSLFDVKGDIDYLMITVKDSGMDTVLLDLDKIKDRVKCVFSFQNGITPDERLAEVVGWDKVMGSVTIEGADMPEPGIIEYNLSSYTYLGEYDNSDSERVKALASVFRGGGMDIRIIKNIKAAKWTKFVQICGASGVCGATRLGFAPAVRTLAGAQIYAGILKEGIAIMRSLGQEPGDYFPGISMVKKVANLPWAESVDAVKAVGEAFYKKGFLGGTSLARDIQRGKKAEVDALMGTLYFIGDKQGIPAPIVGTIYWVTKAVDDNAEG